MLKRDSTVFLSQVLQAGMKGRIGFDRKNTAPPRFRQRVRRLNLEDQFIVEKGPPAARLAWALQSLPERGC